MNNMNKTRLITISAMLTAISFLTVYFMPTFDLGVWSFTFASHVPTFIAMFISPFAAILTYAGTLLAFILKVGNPIVWLRAGSHIVFIIFGLLMLRKYDMYSTKTFKSKFLLKYNKLGKYLYVVLFAAAIALLHAIFESLSVVAGVELFGLSIPVYNFYYVGIMVCAGTFVHSMIDFALAYIIHRSLRAFKIV